jgi:hypothetical protein
MSAAARAEARLHEIQGRSASWARQAVGTFVAAQKILLDLTAQQNAMVIGLVRERLRMPHVNPGPPAARAAVRTVETGSGAGKLLLDLGASETALLAEAVKDGFRLSPVTSAMTNILSHRVDTVIENLKRLIDAVAGQILGALHSYLEGKGLTAEASVADLVRQGILGFVEVEKKFLDLMAEEVNTAVEGTHDGRRPARERGRAMTKLARQAVDEFIDTQKKLLDLAISQFEQSAPAAEADEEEEPEKKTSIAELTQRSVQNLVNAQKSLLELAVKPIRTAVPAKAPAKRLPAKAARKAVRRPAKKRPAVA